MIDLPTSILARLICEWLDLKSLAKYDAAQCNGSNRRDFLEVLRSREVTLNEVTKDVCMNCSILKWISRRSVHVKTLRFFGKCDLTGREARAFFRTVGPRLQELHVRSYDAADVICRIASAFCSQLRALFFDSYSNISGQVLSNLLKCCAGTLTSLRLETAVGLPKFTTHINMSALRCLSLVPDGEVHRESIVELLQKSPNLETFSFVPGQQSSMHFEYLTALSLHCPKLRTLRCEVCTMKQLAVFEQVLQHSPELHTVDILDGLSTDESAVAILRYCPKLRALRLPGLFEQTLPLLLPRMHALEHLGLGTLGCLSDAPILALAECCGNLKSLSFHLSRVRDSPPTPIYVTENALRVLLARLPRVEVLDLTDAIWLKDGLLLTIAAHCPRLRCIALHGTKLQAASITSLIQQCPDLTAIFHDYFHSVLKDEGNQGMWQTVRPNLQVVFGSLGDSQFCHWGTLIADSLM